MADIDVVQQPGGSKTWLWALVAVLAVGGLMAWLAVQSSRTTSAAIVEEGAGAQQGAEAAAADDSEPAELGAVAATPESYVGRRVAIERVEVAADLGPSAFWGDIPGANPFLVLFSPNVTRRPQLEIGRTYNISGVINEVTDSALNEWVESGAIRATARDEAGFATHYLLAERISP